MYIVFTAERVQDYYNDIPIAEYITKCKETVDKFVLLSYNDKEDYLLAEITNDEFKYLDGNKYLYSLLKED